MVTHLKTKKLFMDTSYDIFISYSTKDKSKVSDIINAFKQQGYKVWIDKEGIRGGDPSFKSTLVKAIEQSKIVVFFSSSNSNSSKWTEKEIGIAISKNKYIIPVKLDESLYANSVQFDLINYDFIDFTSCTRRASEEGKLYSSLNKVLGNEREETHKDINKQILKIAESFRKGNGVERDYSFAALLYDKAAKQGNPTAQCNLATLYYNGLGVEKNVPLAATLYRTAANGGSSLAMYKLGKMYFKGDFVAQNYNQAILLYQQAASLGNEQAKKALLELNVF